MTTFYKNFKWHESGELQHMLVDNDRVISRGPIASIKEPSGASTIDLFGKTIYPAFIDNHCHILASGLEFQELHLGSCDSNNAVLDAVRDWLPRIERDKWLHAGHYDPNKFGGVYLNRTDLDAISTTVPIVVEHVNGHAGVSNSAALIASGISDSAQDPSGGRFGRDDDGRLNGVLFEHALEEVCRHMPIPTEDEMVDLILVAGESMARFGIACASDMMTGFLDLRKELSAYRRAARNGCEIWTRLYLQWGEVFTRDGEFRAPDLPELLRDGDQRCRVAGIKIFADGAIGSATAAIYGEYSGAPATGRRISRRARNAAATTEQTVSGQLIYTPERLKEMVKIADRHGFQVSVHSIGDYSTDLVMDAFEEVDDPSKHRIEHAMILSDSQIERMAKLGCHCCMQPEFLLRFGHSYVAQLGAERASMLNRSRSVLDAGVPMSFSSDRPIVEGNPETGIRVATSRPERFSSSENVTPAEAFHAYTVAGAQANGDQELGRLEPGEWARIRIEPSDLPVN